MQMDENISFIF